MLVERLSENGKPNGKCFAKKCSECVHFRLWSVKHKVTQVESHKRLCSLEMLYDTLPDLIGSIDGCQKATNETRNGVLAFGKASVLTLKNIAKNVPKLLK
jgi:hypothetical protein